MRTKKVLRFYCDHCSRGSFRKSVMERHESACCRNPMRFCATCGNPQDVKGKVAELRQRILDNQIAGHAKVLTEIRDISDGCPTCMLAVIILGELSVPPDEDGGGQWFDFNYKDEMIEYRKTDDDAEVRF